MMNIRFLHEIELPISQTDQTKVYETIKKIPDQIISVALRNFQKKIGRPLIFEVVNACETITTTLTESDLLNINRRRSSTASGVFNSQEGYLIINFGLGANEFTVLHEVAHFIDAFLDNDYLSDNHPFIKIYLGIMVEESKTGKWPQYAALREAEVDKELGFKIPIKPSEFWANNFANYFLRRPMHGPFHKYFDRLANLVWK